MNFSPDDLDFERIKSAYNGLSYVPEKRARAQQEEYVQEMEAIRDKLMALATTDEARAAVLEDLATYRDAWVKRFWTWIGAKSRCYSSMIAGPSNFPVRQQEKRSEAERKRLQEFCDWRERETTRLYRKHNPAPDAIIRSDAPDALDRLRELLVDLEATQDRMKTANKIRMSKALTFEQKRDQLAAMGIPIELPGFASYQLTNNNAKIRSTRDRITKLEREATMSNVEIAGDGFRVVENYEAKRVQIFFDGKPDAETRADLKRHGYRWAPSTGAWQGYQNPNARQFAARLLVAHQRKESA